MTSVYFSSLSRIPPTALMSSELPEPTLVSSQPSELADLEPAPPTPSPDQSLAEMREDIRALSLLIKEQQYKLEKVNERILSVLLMFEHKIIIGKATWEDLVLKLTTRQTQAEKDDSHT